MDRLDSLDFESLETCKSCHMKQESNLLGVIHFWCVRSNECWGTQWISLCSYFTDDLSRYRSIYLMNHKSEILKSSKLFQSEDRRDKRINCLRYDHRDEYLSCEFWYTVKTMWKLFRNSCHLEHHSVMVCPNVIVAPYLIWCILWCLLSNYHYRLWVMH